MKEKRVDVALAKAGFYQVMFYGFGGTFLTQLIAYPDIKIRSLIGSALGTLALVIVVYRFYAKATRLSRKSKR